MQRQLKSQVLLLAAFVALGLARQAANGQTPPGGRVGTTNEVVEFVPQSFNHSTYDALLRAHVSNGLVNYAAFRGNARFAQYLASLANADIAGLEEAERIAFWLNVYNAYTIQLVASQGETRSIRNIDKTLGVFSLKGPWSRTFVRAAGRVLSLDDVEHRILRHDFSEPRIHFAMSFAARGGPRLRNEAYTGAKLDEQLEDQTRTFLHESAKNRVDTSRYTVYISPVIARYRTDFGETQTALGRFLADYYPDGPERRFLVVPRRFSPQPPVNVTGGDSAKGGKSDTAKPPPRRPSPRWFRVVETPFDWTLNIQKP